jgi:hypothetical protein
LAAVSEGQFAARVIKPEQQVAANVFCVSSAEEKHTATAPALIAMMNVKLSIRVPPPA